MSPIRRRLASYDLPPETSEMLADFGRWELNIGDGRLTLTPLAAHLYGLPNTGTAPVICRHASLADCIDPADRPRVEACWRGALAGKSYDIEYRVLGSVGVDAAWRWEKITIEYDDTGRPQRAIGFVQDISRHKRQGDATAQKANHDSLTGLPNRNLLGEHLDMALRLAERREQKLAVLFLDLDRFKQVNDTLGHGAGDMLLRETAQRMRTCLRVSDMVARQGGDEFMVVLQDIKHEADAGLVALKLIESIGQAYEISGSEVFVGASIGIAIYPQDGTDAETLFRHADMAMYEAKESGRDTLHFFDPLMSAQAMRRQQVETELRQALQRREFTLLYQPIVDMRSRQLAGVEALIRWNHPQRGLLGPDEFIVIAEETGLVREIGRWVLVEACRQLALWRDNGLLDLRVTVNVSARQIPDGLPLEWLEDALTRHAIPGDRLILEVTENFLLRDTPQTGSWLAAIRRLGIQLSLDDFGTGYASLGYLRRHRMDIIKIDRSFVTNMLNEPYQFALVKSIIAIGENLGMRVVAEGIENAEVMESLHRLGCDYAQGFLLSHPVSADGISCFATAQGALPQLEASLP